MNDAQKASNLTAFVWELRKIQRYRAWWALNDPVAYLWLCRAERRGAIVPWTEING